MNPPLESPFYRVTIKALIFDENNRLLVTQTSAGDWELPGGGWEHGESFAECLQRELAEEIGGQAADIGNIAFAYRGDHKSSYVSLRLAVPVTLKSPALTPGNDMAAIRFVAGDEFMQLPMASDEEPIKDYIGQFWPAGGGASPDVPPDTGPDPTAPAPNGNDSTERAEPSQNDSTQLL